jgi:hypothetical protein
MRFRSLATLSLLAGAVLASVPRHADAAAPPRDSAVAVSPLAVQRAPADSVVMFEAVTLTQVVSDVVGVRLVPPLPGATVDAAPICAFISTASLVPVRMGKVTPQTPNALRAQHRLHSTVASTKLIARARNALSS